MSARRAEAKPVWRQPFLVLCPSASDSAPNSRTPPFPSSSPEQGEGQRLSQLGGRSRREAHATPRDPSFHFWLQFRERIYWSLGWAGTWDVRAAKRSEGLGAPGGEPHSEPHIPPSESRGLQGKMGVMGGVNTCLPLQAGGSKDQETGGEHFAN